MKKTIMITVMISIGTTMFLIPCFAEEVLYGCYQKNNGQLRIVDNPSECGPSEAPVSWNQIGPPGLIWQGPWDIDETYELDDAVSYNGSSYISLVGQNKGYPPDSSPTFWEILAQKGDIGEKGDKGETGEKGATGATGAAGHSPVLTWSGDQIAIDGAVAGPHLTGPKGDWGPAGNSPVLTWSGDQIAIDGVVSGPHLTGPQGTSGASVRPIIYTVTATEYISPILAGGAVVNCPYPDEVIGSFSSYSTNAVLCATPVLKWVPHHHPGDGGVWYGNCSHCAVVELFNWCAYTLTVTVTTQCIGLRPL